MVDKRSKIKETNNVALVIVIQLRLSESPSLGMWWPAAIQVPGGKPQRNFRFPEVRHSSGGGGFIVVQLIDLLKTNMWNTWDFIYSEYYLFYSLRKQANCQIVKNETKYRLKMLITMNNQA